MAFSRIKSFINSAIRKSIVLGMDSIARDARDNADWSKRIPSAIEVGEVKETSEGIFVGEIIVDLKKAPEAAAFEYGSGEHATRKAPGTYEIVARNAPSLAFMWPRVAAEMGLPSDKIFLFEKVDHPGVAPKPYLQPAINKNLRSVRTRILDAFISGYKEGIDVKVVIK